MFSEQNKIIAVTDNIIKVAGKRWTQAAQSINIESIGEAYVSNGRPMAEMMMMSC